MKEELGAGLLHSSFLARSVSVREEVSEAEVVKNTVKMADDGQEIAAIASPPPPPPLPLPPSDIKMTVNHEISPESKETPTPLPLSQPVSSSSPLTSSSSTTSTFSPTPPPSTLQLPNFSPMPAMAITTSPSTAAPPQPPVIVPTSTAKRVILTPISSAPCVSSNSLPSPQQMINRTSSPAGHPVILTPTSSPTISLNNSNNVVTSVPNTGSPIFRAVPASGFINQVSSPLASSSPVPSPVTSGPSDPKQITGTMSGSPVQLSKQPQLPNGTLSPSTVVITSSNAPPPPPPASSTISIPVATRPNIVTATSSSSAILGPSSTQSISNTNGTSQTSSNVNPSPVKTTMIPMSKPQTVFLTTKDGSPMVLQHSTTGGPPTLVPISSANTQPISTSSGTVITFNNQPVTSMSTTPGPRQVLVSNPNNPSMQPMILTRPGMQPTLVQAPGQLRGTPLQSQPRFVLQQNAVRIAPQGTLRPGGPGGPVMSQVIIINPDYVMI